MRTYVFEIKNALVRPRWRNGKSCNDSLIFVVARNREDAEKKHVGYFAEGVKLGFYRAT